MSFISNHRAIEKSPVRFVTKGTVAATTGSVLSPSFPAGILVGDLLILQIYIRTSGQTVNSVSDGFILLSNDTDITPFVRMYVYYKVAVGTESGTVGVTTTGVGPVTIARMSQFRYNAVASPIQGSVLTTATSATVAHGSIAATRRGMVVSCVGISDDVAMAEYNSEVNTDLIQAYQDLSALGAQAGIQMQYGLAYGTDNITGGVYTLAAGSKIYINRSFAIRPK